MAEVYCDLSHNSELHYVLIIYVSYTYHIRIIVFTTAVMESMPEQLSRHAQMQADRDGLNKNPCKKRFRWLPRIR